MSDGPGNSFGFFEGILPPELLAAAKAEHEKTHMRADELGLQIENLIDTLTADQLLVVRKILRMRRQALYHLDGQIMTVMRLSHHVDPDTGEDLLTRLESRT